MFIIMRIQKTLTDVEIEDIISRYNSFHTCKSIADFYHIKRERVKQIIIDRNIKPRERNEYPCRRDDIGTIKIFRNRNARAYYIKVSNIYKPKKSIYNWKEYSVYILEKHLGRNIKKGYHVHHINGNHLDNSIDNLTEITASQHMSFHHKGKSITEKHKHQISVAQKNRIHYKDTDEVKKHKSEAQFLRWKKWGRRK